MQKQKVGEQGAAKQGQAAQAAAKKQHLRLQQQAAAAAAKHRPQDSDDEDDDEGEEEEEGTEDGDLNGLGSSEEMEGLMGSEEEGLEGMMGEDEDEDDEGEEDGEGLSGEEEEDSDMGEEGPSSEDQDGADLDEEEEEEAGQGKAGAPKAAKTKAVRAARDEKDNVRIEREVVAAGVEVERQHASVSGIMSSTPFGSLELSKPTAQGACVVCVNVCCVLCSTQHGGLHPRSVLCVLQVLPVPQSPRVLLPFRPACLVPLYCRTFARLLSIFASRPFVVCPLPAAPSQSCTGCACDTDHTCKPTLVLHTHCAVPFSCRASLYTLWLTGIRRASAP